ncbi:MAG: amidase [Acidobacteriota bacterium]|nr:amidase [Acidobacteriota bacterium]
MNDFSIATLVSELKSGQRSALDLIDSCLKQIDTQDDVLNAFITVFADDAREQARNADVAIAHGHDVGPLHGMPISVKDIIDVRGTPTTAASRVRADHRASRDAELVTRLRQAGAIVIGKCNLHEFAFGTTGHDSAFGPTRNPHDKQRIPGGSSSGSAVSVAADMAIASIGTDTGGSIRIPASACGVVGLKPTHGEVSLCGVVPLAPTLDHAGPLAGTVADAQLLFALLRQTPNEQKRSVKTLDQTHLVIPRKYFFDRMDTEIATIFDHIVRSLETRGSVVTDGEIPHATEIPAVYLHTQLPEATLSHQLTLKEQPELYSPSVRARLELGRYVRAEDYLLAQQARDVLRREVDNALINSDALILPTLPIVPPLLGDDSIALDGETDSVRALTLRLTQLFDLTGHPAISLPCGSIEGVPIGVQLVGHRHATNDLLALATQVEAILNT